MICLHFSESTMNQKNKIEMWEDNCDRLLKYNSPFFFLNKKYFGLVKQLENKFLAPEMEQNHIYISQ